jgi:hypothetical protein
VGKRQSRNQRTALGAVGAPASLDHEPSPGKRPRADRGSLRTAHRTGKHIGPGIQAVQVGQRSSDGKRQLCARAQPGVRRQRTMDLYGDSVTQAVILEKLAGEHCRSGCVFTFHAERAAT